jgi:hypothetical protein
MPGLMARSVGALPPVEMGFLRATGRRAEINSVMILLTIRENRWRIL